MSPVLSGTDMPSQNVAPVVAGVDISTTGARVILVDEVGTAIGRGASTFTSSGAAAHETQTSADWLGAVDAAFREAIGTVTTHRQVAVQAVGIASQGVTVMPVNDGDTVEESAVSWLSTSSRSADEIHDPTNWFAGSGRRLTSAFLAVQAPLRHDAGLRPPRHWSLVGEVVAHSMTNRRFAGPCLASSTGLLDPRTRQWADALLKDVGIDRAQLADVRELDAEPIYALTNSRLRGWGVSPSTIVVPPTQDQRAAAAIADPDGSKLLLTTGTAAAIIARTTKPILDRDRTIPLIPSWHPDEWELEGVVGSAGASLTWATGALGFASVVELLDSAARSPVGSSGVKFSPHLAGALSPTWDERRRGGFANVSIATTRSDLARAVVEGVCREIVRNCRSVEALVGIRDETVLLGGLSRHPLIGSVLGAMLGRPIRAVQMEHPTVLGAAARAGMAIGWNLLPNLATTVAATAVTRHPQISDALAYSTRGDR